MIAGLLLDNTAANTFLRGSTIVWCTVNHCVQRVTGVLARARQRSDNTFLNRLKPTLLGDSRVTCSNILQYLADQARLRSLIQINLKAIG
jgi:hypothetical protein